MDKLKFLIFIAIIILVIVIISDVEFYYMIKPSEKSEQEIKQFNVDGLNLINDCMKFQTIASLAKCKDSITNLKTQCENAAYSSLDICKDSRIDQFLEAVDSKITSAQDQIIETAVQLNSSITHLIKICTETNTPSCQSSMIEVKQECMNQNRTKIKACDDPKIDQIISMSIK